MDVERSVAAVPFDHALLHAVHAMARWQRRTLHSIRADRGVVPGSGSTDQRSASAKSKGARTGVRGTAGRIATDPETSALDTARQEDESSAWVAIRPWVRVNRRNDSHQHHGPKNSARTTQRHHAPKPGELSPCGLRLAADQPLPRSQTLSLRDACEAKQLRQRAGVVYRAPRSKETLSMPFGSCGCPTCAIC